MALITASQYESMWPMVMKGGILKSFGQRFSDLMQGTGFETTPLCCSLNIWVSNSASRSLGSGLALFFMGCLVLAYGLSRNALDFNPFNLWRNPLPVWAARLIYIPMALILFYYAARNLFGALR
jgi:hypothetical protein